jgi:DNA invertase Pin-like site-specific DNA recombinase
MAWTSVDHLDGGLHGAGAESVHGFLERLKAEGLGATVIAKALGIGRASVYRALEGGIGPIGEPE